MNIAIMNIAIMNIAIIYIHIAYTIKPLYIILPLYYIAIMNIDMKNIA